MIIVLVNYLVPIERIDELLPEHRAFLRRQYDAGLFLASGPRNPRIGGIIIARGQNREDLLEILKEDPFYREGVASYELISFDPVLHQPALNAFFGK